MHGLCNRTVPWGVGSAWSCGVNEMNVTVNVVCLWTTRHGSDLAANDGEQVQDARHHRLQIPNTKMPVIAKTVMPR